MCDYFTNNLMNSSSDSLTALFKQFQGLFQNPSKQTLVASSTIVIGLSALPILYHAYLLCKFKDEVPMSFSWIPFLGHALEFGTNPIKTLQKLSKDANGKTKDIFGLVLAGKRIILITNPLSFKVIFKSKKELSFDVFSRQVLINVFGASPETTNGIHTEAEPLSRNHYNKYLLQDEGCGILTDRMQIKLGEIIRDMPAADVTVDMFSFLNRLIFRAAATSLFNVELGDDDEIFQKFVAFDDVFALALAGCPMKFLAKGYEGREMLLGGLFKYKQGLSGFIQERYQLLGERFHYPDRDIQANHLSMLWASVGNTMPATFWVFYYLLNSPEALAAVQQEIQTVLQPKLADLNNQNDPSRLLMVTLEDLQKMVILESCISESLRLSTGSLIMREAVEPCTLTLADGSTYKIRKGDNVGIFPPIVHRDERFFENSETFQFDRFLKMKETFQVDGVDVPSSQCFLPFGGGVSYCPGRKFARNEIKTLAIHLLLKFEMALSESSVSKPVAVDYSRAGLGIFQPKDCTLQLKLTLKR